jgi:1-deoxy-D-xylulose-5-phosphate reductoisomerase
VIGVVVLGSTGSIGESTLDVLARHPDRFRVVGLGARRNTERLYEQVRRWRPDYVALADRDAAGGFAARMAAGQSNTRVLGGEEGLVELAQLPDAQIVMAAIVGAAGLRSTLAAAGAGKRLLLANKESLVMAGPLVIAAARAGGATLLPIDSEHNAIFQCLPRDTACGAPPAGVRRVLLTASGGPFIDWPTDALRGATPEQACAHPNWIMGRKISVDSATLMNKGLEIIEARLLFGLAAEQIEVVVHRQSIVHSLVEYVDGSVLAQLGAPDMRTPIAQALAWPDRMASGAPFLDLAKVGRLDFCAPDPARFPSLRLAQAAAREGGLAPAILSAANEIAVQAFLERHLNFTDIPAVTETVLEAMPGGNVRELDEVLAADEEARVRARAAVAAARPTERSALA